MRRWGWCSARGSVRTSAGSVDLDGLGVRLSLGGGGALVVGEVGVEGVADDCAWGQSVGLGVGVEGGVGVLGQADLSAGGGSASGGVGVPEIGAAAGEDCAQGGFVGEVSSAVGSSDGAQVAGGGEGVELFVGCGLGGTGGCVGHACYSSQGVCPGAYRSHLHLSVSSMAWKTSRRPSGRMAAPTSRNVRDSSWGRPTNMKVTSRASVDSLLVDGVEEGVLDVFVWDVVLAGAVCVVDGHTIIVVQNWGGVMLWCRQALIPLERY